MLMSERELELTILMPCLDEAETLAICINQGKQFLTRSGLAGEILVADNGSRDRSREIAKNHGARIVDVPERGYGAALLCGIKASRGRYVIMGDSDASYDFSKLDDFVAELRQGCDLVIGNRFKGGIAPGAMPPLHKYFGNPVLTRIGQLFFHSPISDFQCGLRGCSKAAILDLDLQTRGMEFASEMIVKATIKRLRLAEVPTTLSVDGRGRPPHLRSWPDGWRHLRFLLMHAPRWLFLYPGLALITVGMTTMVAVLPGPLKIGSVIFDVHTLLFAMASILIGTQTTQFFLLVKRFAANQGLLSAGPRFVAYRRMTSLERTALLGVIMTGVGLIGSIYAVVQWGSTSFGDLDYSWMMRLAIPSVTLMGVGIQLVLTGFFAGILDLKTTITSSTD